MNNVNEFRMNLDSIFKAKEANIFLGFYTVIKRVLHTVRYHIRFNELIVIHRHMTFKQINR